MCLHYTKTQLYQHNTMAVDNKIGYVWTFHPINMSCMYVMKGQTPFCDTCKEFIFFATKVF